MKSFMTGSVFTWSLLRFAYDIFVSKFVTISGFFGIQINVNLNVINIMFVVTDNSDRRH